MVRRVRRAVEPTATLEAAPVGTTAGPVDSGGIELLLPTTAGPVEVVGIELPTTAGPVDVAVETGLRLVSDVREVDEPTAVADPVAVVVETCEFGDTVETEVPDTLKELDSLEEALATELVGGGRLEVGAADVMLLLIGVLELIAVKGTEVALCRVVVPTDCDETTDAGPVPLLVVVGVLLVPLQ